MSLSALASEFNKQATGSSGNITVNSASFTAAGLTPPADLDDILQKGFQLATGSSLLINIGSTPVGEPVGNVLTISSATAAVLNVDASNTSVSFVITDDGTGNIEFVIVISLSNWTFSTSWKEMTGGVYSALPYTSPAFIFSTQQCTQYSWQQNTIPLVAGQNFACLITLTGILQQVVNFLASAWSGISLPLAGMLDPSNVNGDDIIFPDMDLKVNLNVDVINLSFLQVTQPSIGFSIYTYEEEITPDGEEDDSPAVSSDPEWVTKQETSLYFGLILVISNSIRLNFTTVIMPDSKAFTIGVIPDPLTPLTPLNVFSIMAGNNWFTILPPTLQQYLNKIAFKGFSTALNFNNGLAINSVSATIGSNGKWVLFDNFVIDQFDLQWLILDPGPGGANAQSVYLTADVSFFPNLFKGGFHVEITSSLNLSASFEGEVSFNDLLSEITGGAIDIPTDVASVVFTSFGMSMDISSKYYSFYATTEIDLNFITNISVTNGNLQLTSSSSVTDGGPTVYTAAVSGMLTIGMVSMDVAVNYNSGDAGGWDLSISMPADDTLNLGDLIDSLFKTITSAQLPSGFLPACLVITEFALKAVIPNDKAGTSSYSVTTAIDWKFTFPIINQPIDVIAKLMLEYESGANGAPGSYSGGVAATIILTSFNAQVDIAYNFSKNDQKLTIVWEGFTAEYDVTGQSQTITFSIQNWTLGGLLTSFMKMLGDADFELDSPWDLLNDISLNGFKVTYNLTTSDIKVTYQLPKTLDLVFIKIDSLNLTKNSKGTFISFGGSSPIPSINDSTLFKPDQNGGSDVKNMPAVPGQGTEYFELRLLAMGQHVELVNAAQYKTIKQVTDQMEVAFDEPDPNNPAIPVGPNSGNTLLAFNEDSSWLIATDFGILNVGTKDKPIWTVDMQVVFNDPALYGLRIALSGAKAKVFAGLEFDIMYKKISDSVGVYQIDLTLPNALRNLQFGAVNITLPSISLQIYTNGDFMVDVGFPHNMDFSKSFTLQAIVPPGIPAMGSGGFYFGKLSSATTNKVPATQYGSFNPVIVFGIGLQIGVGYSVNYGILSAGFSITLFGIIEGVIATYHPYEGTLDGTEKNSQSVETSYYYYLQGTVGIIGKLYGSIDFGIISASVNITIMIYAQITFEAYNKIPISIVASVDVKVSASLNLGLFKITIHFSFTATIRQDLTIGTDNRANAPWNNNLNAQQSFAAFASPSPMAMKMAAAPLLFTTTLIAAPGGQLPALSIYLVPHLTVSGPGAGPMSAQQAQYVTTLFIDAPDPAATAGSGPVSSFESMCGNFFMWLIANFLNQSGSTITIPEAGALGISKNDLDALVAYLSDRTNTFPLPVAQLLNFLQNSFSSVNISEMTANINSGAIFPMLFDLVLNVPSLPLNIDFSQYNMANDEYLSAVKQWFSELAVSMQQNGQQASVMSTGASDSYSISTFIFEDYFVLLGKQLAGYASDAMDNYTYPLVNNPNGNSLQAMVNWANGISADGNSNMVKIQDIATANQDHPLASGVTVSITGLIHLTQSNQTTTDNFVTVASLYSLVTDMLITQNSSIPGILLAGQQVKFGSNTYNVLATDTVATVATQLGTTISVLAADPTFQSTAQLQMGVGLIIAGLHYAAKNEDTFVSVAGMFNVTDITGLLMQNQAVAGLFIPGKQFTYNGTQYTIVTGDTLVLMAQKISASSGTAVTPQNLAANADVQGQSIQPNGPVLIQPLSYTTATYTDPANADTFTKLASKFDTTTAIIASNYANGQLSNIFYSGAGYTQANVPGLVCLDVAGALQYFSNNGSYSQLSGMASRYQLHGMQLPVKGMPGLTLSAGSPCANSDTCALYAMTGQEFALPATVAAGFTIELINNDLSWLEFNGLKNTDPGGNSLTITLQQQDIDQITSVLGYAQSTGVKPKDVKLAPMQPFDLLPVQYTFQTVTKWRTSGALILPYGEGLPEQTNATPLIWAFPSGMLQQLALPKVAGSKFDVQIGQYDATTGLMNYNGSSYYGWNTMLEIEIKKLAVTSTAPTTTYTYELIGADEAGALILQELLAALTPEDPDNNTNIVTDIQWLYEGNDGLVSVGMNNMKSFIIQANQSTETNPSTPSPMFMAMKMTASGLKSGILNSTYDFIKLLWECSITRSGGYYLLYNETGADKGFPDSIFSKGDTASIRIMVGYSSDFNGIPATYMNCAVTGDKIDVSSCVVYAESAQQTGIKYSITSDNDTLASVASKFNILISELAALNAGVALNTTALPLPVIQLNNLVYEVGGASLPNDLNSIVKYFGVDETALKNANPAITNWNSLAVWQLVNIPTVNYTVSSAAGTAGNLLSTIAAYYFIDMSTLAWAAKDVKNLFPVNATTPVQLAVVDQIMHKVSNVPQGAAGFDLQRANSNPPENPIPVGDPGYAENYLNNLYNLLSYQVVDNIAFTASKVGLPAGPGTSQDKDDMLGKNSSQDDSGPWMYKQVVPLAKFAKPNTYMQYPAGFPQQSGNPYCGIGYYAQVHFDWVDYYGNNTVTPFNNPSMDPLTPLNNPPIQVGYTDELNGFGKWPSLETSYAFDLNASMQPELLLNFNFNNKRYVPIPGIPQYDPQQQDWKTNAEHDLAIYTNIYYQITQLNPYNGTNTVSISLSCSLTPGKSITIDPSGALLTFVKCIYTYLTQIISVYPDGTAASAIPVPVMSPIATTINPSTDLDTQSILQLIVAVDFVRDISFVNTDFRDSSLVTRSTSTIKPQTFFTVTAQASAASTGDDIGEQHSLKEFAVRFESAFLSKGNYVLKVAIGTNTTMAGSSNSQAVYVVRMGMKAGQGIYWNITEAGCYEITAQSLTNLSNMGVPVEVITALNPLVSTFYDNKTAFDAALLQQLGQDNFNQYCVSIYMYSLLNPVFYAPRPLATTLVSKNGVPIYPYTTGEVFGTGTPVLKNFTGIDMDNWGAQTLNAIDVFMSSEYSVPAFIVDQLMATAEQDWLEAQGITADSFSNAITDAKKLLADVISSEIIPILTAPAVPDIGDTTGGWANAKEKFKQQLLNQLGNAYTINAFVQFNTTAQSDFTGSGDAITPPRLYGVPMIIQKNAPQIDGHDIGGVVEDPSINLEYSISTTKVQLNGKAATEDNSYLTFSFTTKNPEKAASVELNMSYVVTHIEFEITDMDYIEGYQGSNWLTFIVPADVTSLVNDDPTNEVLIQALGSVDIPIVLRNYPSAPALTTQVGNAVSTSGSTTKTRLAEASEWDYVYAFTRDQAAQDIIFSEVEFNYIQNPSAAFAFKQGRDLFADMAQFVAVWPNILQDFNTYLSAINVASTTDDKNLNPAYSALLAFVSITHNLSIAWSQYSFSSSNGGGSSSDSKRITAFSITQQENSKGDDILKLIVSSDLSSDDLSYFGVGPNDQIVQLPDMPYVSIESYDTVPALDAEKQPIPNEYWFQVPNSSPAEYLPYSTSLDIPSRTVNIDSLNVLQFQYAWGGVAVIRNENLVEGNPTAKQFIYRTPLVKFSNKLIPLLSSEDQINIAKIQNESGLTLPLANQLANFFSTFFEQDELNTQLMKLTVSWNYTVLPSGGIQLPPIQLPILLAPPFAFSIPSDYQIPAGGCQPVFSPDDPFICRLANTIKMWYQQRQPSTNNAWLQFDVSVFSSQNDNKLPLIDLQNVVLYFANINDMT